jgi:hypothetical protein
VGGPEGSCDRLSSWERVKSSDIFPKEYKGQKRCFSLKIQIIGDHKEEHKTYESSLNCEDSKDIELFCMSEIRRSYVGRKGIFFMTFLLSKREYSSKEVGVKCSNNKCKALVSR